MCEAYLKHHEDKQNGVHVNASVCVCMCVRERESEISKQKVLCWNPIVCIHMVSELELTLGICVRDIIIL